MRKNVFTIILMALLVMLPNSIYSKRPRKFLPCGCEIIQNDGKKNCGLCGRLLECKTRVISKSGFETKSVTDYWCDNHDPKHEHIALSNDYDYGRDDTTHVCNEQECIKIKKNKNSTEQTVYIKNVCPQKRIIPVAIYKDNVIYYVAPQKIKPDEIWTDSFPVESNIVVKLLRRKK